MSEAQQRLEALRRRVADLAEKNASKRKSLEYEKKAFVEGQLKLMQLKSQLATGKEMLKKTKASIEIAQRTYHHEFDNIKRATHELQNYDLEIVNRRRKASKFIGFICDAKIGQMHKNLDAIEACSYTKAKKELDEIHDEKLAIRERIAEIEKKILDVRRTSNNTPSQMFLR